jgi:hypothetical protein
VAFEPNWGGFGFGVRAGGFKNRAVAAQAFTLTAGLGLRLWVVLLDFAGQVGLDNTKFGTDDDNQLIPQRFGFSVELGQNFEF